MRTLLKYLFGQTIRDRLPRLGHTLKNPTDWGEVDRDTELVLLAGIARDPYEVQRLMEKYGAKTGAELLAKLPPRRIDYLERIRSWLRAVEGAYDHDPHRKELMEGIRERRGKW